MVEHRLGDDCPCSLEDQKHPESPSMNLQPSWQQSTESVSVPWTLSKRKLKIGKITKEHPSVQKKERNYFLLDFLLFSKSEFKSNLLCPDTKALAQILHLNTGESKNSRHRGSWTFNPTQLCLLVLKILMVQQWGWKKRKKRKWEYIFKMLFFMIQCSFLM